MVARRHAARRADVVAGRHAARRTRARRGRPAPPKPGETPLSDYRYIDRLGYQYNGAGFIDDKDAHLWLVDAATGEARPLVAGPTPEAGPAWSPDGTRIAFAANRQPARRTSTGALGIFVVDVATGAVTTIAGGADATFRTPAGPVTARRSSRSATASRGSGTGPGIWRFAADGSDAGTGGTDLLARQRAQARRRDEQRRHDRRASRRRGRPPTARPSCSRRPSTAATSCGASRSRAAGSPSA